MTCQTKSRGFPKFNKILVFNIGSSGIAWSLPSTPHGVAQGNDQPVRDLVRYKDILVPSPNLLVLGPTLVLAVIIRYLQLELGVKTRARCRP
jgi:hypothetical protein